MHPAGLLVQGSSHSEYSYSCYDGERLVAPTAAMNLAVMASMILCVNDNAILSASLIRVLALCNQCRYTAAPLVQTDFCSGWRDL